MRRKKTGICDGDHTSKSTSSAISTASIRHIVERLKMDRVRDTTKNNYYGIWRSFNEFFIKLDLKPETWEERMVLYAGYLADNQQKSATIKSYMSAIKSVLKDDGVEICEDRFLLTSITRACGYKNDRITTRLPIQKGILNILLNNLFQIFQDQPYLLALYQALFITAYFGMFRVGELTTGTHPVLAKDVHIADNKNKMMFVLHTSKTHWTNNNPQIIKISSVKQNNSSSANSLWFCPYKLIRNYLSVRKKEFRSTNEPFFIFRDRSPVTPDNFRRTLKLALEMARLNFRNYNCQSFRSGRASDLLRMKVPVEVIRRLGRWRSSAIYKYFK